LASIQAIVILIVISQTSKVKAFFRSTFCAFKDNDCSEKETTVQRAAGWYAICYSLWTLEEALKMVDFSSRL